MFNKNDLKNPRNAIDDSCNKDEKMKCGWKMLLQNLIKQSAKIIVAHFLMVGNQEEGFTFCDFWKVLVLVKIEIFNGAIHRINWKRNKITRNSSSLPY